MRSSLLIFLYLPFHYLIRRVGRYQRGNQNP